jgi:hypothetical protein
MWSVFGWIGTQIDNLLGKIPIIGEKLKEAGVGETIGEGIETVGKLGSRASMGVIAGITDSDGLAAAAEGQGKDLLKGTPLSPFAGLRESYAKNINQNPTLFGRLPQKVQDFANTSYTDPAELQRQAMIEGAKRARAGGGQYSSFGGQKILINQVNYQPGADNIAYQQRQMGMSGGLL